MRPRNADTEDELTNRCKVAILGGAVIGLP